MSQQKKKAYALKIPKRQGEKAIRVVATLGLLDKTLRIAPEGEFLFIPMVEKLEPKHIAKIKKGLRTFEIVVHEFAVQPKRPKSALEVAVERLPLSLRESFPRSVDFVGEIAIVEIPAELEKYKTVVGEAILKAQRNVRTVLAKSGAVGGVRRLREFEVIGGKPDTETVHREHGCRYFVDLGKVYFSPRLSNEHLRVASQVKEGETVVDLFAGAGPFSVLIAKLRSDVKVYAVDVNPDAVRYLEKNITVNGVFEKVFLILGDARTVVQEKLRRTVDRVIMNLPERAVEYVDVACEALKPEGGIVHYYEFSEGADAAEAAKKHLAEAVGKASRTVSRFMSSRTVREVAPFKWQIAVDAIVQ
jgi:tRNA (guanine37-N1)-methyltransferase